MSEGQEVELPQSLGAIFNRLLENAQTGGALQIKESATHGALKILELKSVHRLLCESTEALREGTVDAKTHLDQASLHLQNLIYEKHHYEKEIASCTSFRSAYSDEKLELLAADEFAADPQAAELQTDDPHALMLNRLEHELTLRQTKLKELEALKQKRDALAADVAQRRSMLSGLEAEVGRLLAMARKGAKQYGVPLEDDNKAGDIESAEVVASP